MQFLGFRGKRQLGEVCDNHCMETFSLKMSQIDEYVNNAARAKSVRKVCHTIVC